MILFVGATGQLGRKVAQILRRNGQPVRALCRGTSEPAVVQALIRSGAECVAGDLRDGDSLARACRGVEVVVSTASAISRTAPGDTLEEVGGRGHLRLLQAAEEAGVQRFVFVSFAMPPGFRREFPMWSAKRAMERALRSSGLEYAIIHPAPFMESWLTPAGGLDCERRWARLVGPGNNRVSFVSIDDVARCVAAAVYEPGAANRVLPLGGPEAPTWLEVVRRFERAAGEPFHVEHVPLSSVEERFARERDLKLRSLLALTLGVAHDWVIPPPGTPRPEPAGLKRPRPVSCFTAEITVDDYIQRKGMGLPPRTVHERGERT